MCLDVFLFLLIVFSLSLSVQRSYSPGWASASFRIFLHPSWFRATIFQFLLPYLATSSSTLSSQRSLQALFQLRCRAMKNSSAQVNNLRQLIQMSASTNLQELLNPFSLFMIIFWSHSLLYYRFSWSLLYALSVFSLNILSAFFTCQ